MYVCPHCKTPLENLYCNECRHRYTCDDGIPILLSIHFQFQEALGIAAAYDSIYQSRTDVWEDQGRTRSFLDYFSSLLSPFSDGRFLEIGCGGGFLLASVMAKEKFAVDLSVEAIRAARTRTEAHFSIALAERLPFPTEHFDSIAAVGVMEHFLDDDEALREIGRVLKTGGHFFTLVHVRLTLWERLGLQVSAYALPRPRPIRLARWLATKLRHGKPKEFVKQPIQNMYTTRSAGARLRNAGFKVMHTIHTRRYPQLPLIGPYVNIYVVQK